MTDMTTANPVSNRGTIAKSQLPQSFQPIKGEHKLKSPSSDLREQDGKYIMTQRMRKASEGPPDGGLEISDVEKPKKMYGVEIKKVFRIKVRANGAFREGGSLQEYMNAESPNKIYKRYRCATITQKEQPENPNNVTVGCFFMVLIVRSIPPLLRALLAKTSSPLTL
jgi:hypothetical protein